MDQTNHPMKKTILALFCIAALASCKKPKDGATGPQGPQGPAGPSGSNGTAGTGVITGKVEQQDQYNVPYTTGLNTSTVSIDGTTITAMTDAAGNYTLSNLGAGVYDISYTKAGTGVDKNQQIVFPGTGTLYLNGRLIDKPSYTLNSGYVKDTTLSGNPYIRAKVYYTTNTKNRSAMVVIGGSSSVDLATPGSYKYLINMQLQANSTTASFNLSYPNVLVNNYPSGTIVYAKVYPYSGGNYYDYINSIDVPTGYGTPLAGTFTLTMP